jgi:Mrp family chromosome partitioning ATPase
VVQARDRLQNLGINILGVVVNGLDTHSYRANYYRAERYNVLPSAVGVTELQSSQE